ncbi:MAG TPA: DNA repair protein RecO [Bacteroidales bacterium]|jgi:DNA repair protein RecO (recombination protein O)|nr:DNA repair protein RecO [Bacteroidales bacterium]|tara:strand:+ start:1588 stop:2334 length:747 start_codon:yes stop_codon:yes gene_type:complete
MLLKTKGIVIKQTKFSDSGVIVKIFTEELGIQSFFVRGLRSRKSNRSTGGSKSKAAMYQPLTMLNLVVSYSENKSLHHINEVSIWYPYQSITENMIKRTLLIFINELLHKSLKEETANKDLFNWIHQALLWLDLADDGFVNFHLVFMMQLSMFLGFYPKKELNENLSVLDMQEGRFSNKRPNHPYYVTGETAKILCQIRDTKFEDSFELKLNNKNRRVVLETLISYYKLHLPSFGEFKSLEVLSVVLA